MSKRAKTKLASVVILCLLILVSSVVAGAIAADVARWASPVQYTDGEQIWLKLRHAGLTYEFLDNTGAPLKRRYEGNPGYYYRAPYCTLTWQEMVEDSRTRPKDMRGYVVVSTNTLGPVEPGEGRHNIPGYSVIGDPEEVAKVVKVLLR